MADRSPEELKNIRRTVDWVGRLSDSVVGVGRFSIGLDGVLSWIPGLGEIYSLTAGGFILIQGVRAGVSIPILAVAATLMFGRTVISAAPLVGPLAADLFMAHKWSARLICRAIDQKLEASMRPATSARASWGAGSMARRGSTATI